MGAVRRRWHVSCVREEWGFPSSEEEEPREPFKKRILFRISILKANGDVYILASGALGGTRSPEKCFKLREVLSQFHPPALT